MFHPVRVSAHRIMGCRYNMSSVCVCVCREGDRVVDGINISLIDDAVHDDGL